MRRFLLRHLQEAARNRPAGYYERFLAAGRVVDGVLEVEDVALEELRRAVRLERVAARDALCHGCEERVGVARCALVKLGCQDCLLEVAACPVGRWRA